MNQDKVMRFKRICEMFKVSIELTVDILEEHEPAMDRMVASSSFQIFEDPIEPNVSKQEKSLVGLKIINNISSVDNKLVAETKSDVKKQSIASKSQLHKTKIPVLVLRQSKLADSLAFPVKPETEVELKKRLEVALSHTFAYSPQETLSKIPVPVLPKIVNRVLVTAVPEFLVNGQELSILKRGTANFVKVRLDAKEAKQHAKFIKTMTERARKRAHSPEKAARTFENPQSKKRKVLSTKVDQTQSVTKKLAEKDKENHPLIASTSSNAFNRLTVEQHQNSKMVASQKARKVYKALKNLRSNFKNIRM